MVVVAVKVCPGQPIVVNSRWRPCSTQPEEAAMMRSCKRWQSRLLFTWIMTLVNNEVTGLRIAF